MWTRQELKSNAKKSLTGSYWMALLVTLIAMVLTGSTTIFQSRLNSDDMHRFAGMEVAWATLLQNFWVQLIIAALGVAALVGFLFRIFVSTVIHVGEARWFSRNRESKPVPSLAQMFSLFQSSNWLPTVGAMLWMYFWLWLWSLLPMIPIFFGIMVLVVYITVANPISWPANWDWNQQWQQNWAWDGQNGRFRQFQEVAPDFFKNNQSVIIAIIAAAVLILMIAAILAIPVLIKRYAYRMTPWILADNPKIGYRRALKLSRQMTKGHKFDIFVLDLSFIGWYLLGLCLFVVGAIFVRPYYKATIAELYAVLRQNTVNQGLATMEDFGFRAVTRSQPATMSEVQPDAPAVETRLDDVHPGPEELQPEEDQPESEDSQS